jgi:hypothetical protein
MTLGILVSLGACGEDDTGEPAPAVTQYPAPTPSQQGQYNNVYLGQYSYNLSAPVTIDGLTISGTVTYAQLYQFATQLVQRSSCSCLRTGWNSYGYGAVWYYVDYQVYYSYLIAKINASNARNVTIQDNMYGGNLQAFDIFLVDLIFRQIQGYTSHYYSQYWGSGTSYTPWYGYPGYGSNIGLNLNYSSGGGTNIGLYFGYNN